MTMAVFRNYNYTKNLVNPILFRHKSNRHQPSPKGYGRQVAIAGLPDKARRAAAGGVKRRGNPAFAPLELRLAEPVKERQSLERRLPAIALKAAAGQLYTARNDAITQAIKTYE